MSNTKVYVGNLSPSTGESDLRSVFCSIGEVSDVTIVKDHATGASRGFAFIELGTDDQARAAIEQLNATDLDGRSLVVRAARQARASRRGH